ncbi:MAG: HD domain-containing protein [Deltaproteobacteria bacterium]|nr:HD domain-containing protein [Deltaproteobacteria bacterium]
MRRASGLQSIFSQQLDRALFATYFLGAVVPLLAVGYLVQRYAIPAVEGDSLAISVLLGITLGIVILSLAAFLALRRLSLNAVQRMNADNDRLAAILAASRDLATAPHVHAAAALAAGCALRLAGSHVILILRKLDEGKDWELCESAGQGASQCFSERGDAVVELAELAVRTRSHTPTQPVGDAVGLAIPMLVEGGAAGALVVVADAVRGRPDRIFPTEVIDALATLAGLSAVALQGAELKDSQQNFFTHSTEIMVTALDSHNDHRTGGCHVVAQSANKLARELGMTDEETLRRLHFAALLADIGMLKLSPAQQKSRQHVARHPVLGHRILSRIRLWRPLAEIVLHHHDRFDGTGTDETLRADAIPIEARIIHVADAFACMTHGGEGGTTRTTSGALEEIVADAGRQYDPRVVQALHSLIERGDIGGDR